MSQQPAEESFIEKLTTETGSTFTQNICNRFFAQWKLILVCFIGLFVCPVSYLFCNFSELLNPAVIEGERLIKRENLRRSCSTGPSRVNLLCNITRTRLRLFQRLSSSAYTHRETLLLLLPAPHFSLRLSLSLSCPLLRLPTVKSHGQTRC